MDGVHATDPFNLSSNFTLAEAEEWLSFCNNNIFGFYPNITGMLINHSILKTFFVEKHLEIIYNLLLLLTY